MEHNTPQFDHRKSNNTCSTWYWTLQFQCSIAMSTSSTYRPKVISILLFYKILHKLHVPVRISFNIIPLFSKYNFKRNETCYQKTELCSSVAWSGQSLKKAWGCRGNSDILMQGKVGVISFLRNVDTFSNHQSRNRYVWLPHKWLEYFKFHASSLPHVN